MTPEYTHPTATDAVNILEALARDYGQPASVVGRWAPLDRVQALARLRALEMVGLTAIKSVVLEKRWVVTAAGVVWLMLNQVGGRVSRAQVLCSPVGYWMTADELQQGLKMLYLGGYITGHARADGGAEGDPRDHDFPWMALTAEDPFKRLDLLMRDLY